MIDLRKHIRRGDTVIVGQATSEPRALVEALVEQRHDLAPLRVFVGASFTGLFRPDHGDAFQFIGYGGIGRTSELTKAGVLDVLPVHIGSLPALIRSGRLAVDVVLAQVSTATASGEHSLGLAADYLPAAIERARVTIGEVNPLVPFTNGDGIIRTDQLAAVVHDDRPLVTVERRAPLAEDETIARRVAALIPDGATIQFGVGGTPDAVLAHLHDKRDLGVHSGLISDALVDLIEAGVVTNRRKEIDTGMTVTGSLHGTARLYEWADRNPTLTMRALDYTHEPRVLGALGALFAINSAIEVDLSGQINGEVAAGQYVGTIGGQGAFARAAMGSATGRSIVALPATARDGRISRVVARIADGVVSTPRADADLVVTEFGVADLRGASLSERARRLVAVADPRHRDDLMAARSHDDRHR